ncbi:MAG: class I SAM-dependent methyltransferase [Peptococcaceae bacterium]|nr:class I SAM-dependent methyltransferase [Peptococcaceae bacterium]
MAYETLASIYDALMDDVNYEQWADYIHDQLQKQGCPGNRLLDLGCGTGNITVPLARKGYDITAVDLSAEMLAQAKTKTDALQKCGEVLHIDWQQQDITELELYDAKDNFLMFDGVIATFDAFNYILEPEALQFLLQDLADHMNDHGILLFDIQTPYKLRKYLGDNIYTLHRDEVEYVWENHFDEETQICQMDITFFLRQEHDVYRRVTESHAERVYEPDLLRLWLELSGFDVLGIYQELSELPLERDSHRAVFVARRRALEDLDDALFDDLESYAFVLED